MQKSDTGRIRSGKLPRNCSFLIFIIIIINSQTTLRALDGKLQNVLLYLDVLWDKRQGIEYLF